MTWLSGTFALPMPIEGCAKGCHEGSIKQDTYNFFKSNSWSSGIRSRLYVNVNASYIETFFCVKKEQDLSNEIAWPQGSYCIAKVGIKCPEGFSIGHIKWDDKDIRNKNTRKGSLPDGEYDRNTKINFCCRSDSLPKEPAVFPVENTFVLYRYSSYERCQTVVGMRVQEDYILWIDEFAFNRDERKGSYPDDDGGKKKHKLHYCYYTLEN